MQQQDSPRVGVLRIFRVEEGTTVHARTLSDIYRGLFTHYYKGRSEWCQGEKCESMMHKLPRVWKGYAAVETWSVGIKRWVPTVLEISEALELDFRGLWKRGQIWELYRDMPVKKKHMPIMGKLLEENDPATLPPEFPITSPLLHLYHVAAIRLGETNPMPPRVMITDSEGPGPKILDPVSDAQAGTIDPAVEAEFRKKFNLDRKSPTERKKK